jgi:hypothetical protein
MDHHQIPRIEQGWHHQPAPLQVVCAPAHAIGIGLALDTIQLVPATRPAPAWRGPGAAGWRHHRPASRARCEDVAVQMLAQPGVAELLGIRLQRVVREGVLLPGRSKEGRALGVVPGEGPRPLEGFGLAHQLHPLACLTQAGGSDLAGCFQAYEQDALLSRVHPASAPLR